MSGKAFPHLIYIKEMKTIKQVNNDFDECFWLLEDGRLYNAITEKYIKCDKKY